MLTILAFLGMLFSVWLFYNGYVEAGAIMFLVSVWAWSND